MHVKACFALLAVAVVFVQAKPSHPFGFHGIIPDHFDLVPPVLPPAHFHAEDPVPLYPYNQDTFLSPAHFHAGPFLPASAPLLPAPAPFLPAPAPLLPAPAPFLPAPAPLLPAPAPLLPAAAAVVPGPASVFSVPAPLLPASAPLLPAPVIAAPILPPAVEAIPIAQPLPTYRVIPGPKTTTHHLSVGYAFPQPRLAKLHTHGHAVPHAHLHAAPFTLAHHQHHHHTLF